MYCILCSKHKTRNKQNQADIFTGKPGTRYKKSALKSHADSDRHKAAIEAELLQKNSQFAKDVADRAAKGDNTMFSAFMSAYWQNMKWPTPNFCPFLNFLKHLE